MSIKLKERISDYEAISDYKLMARLPLIIVINGRSFSKLTQFLDKPYCSKLAECMFSTAFYLCSEIEGVLFCYQFNDEIILILRNDQNTETTPWLDNRIQKLCSITAAIATLHFNKCADHLQLNLSGEATFTSQVFTVPTIGEASNTIIYKQQQNFHSSLQLACLYELLKTHDKNSIKEMLAGLSMDEKIDLLKQECSINFNDYPVPFKRGVAVYKVPKLVDGLTKHKWFINENLPIFTRDQSFLNNIFRAGADIFRQNSLSESE